MNRLEFLLGEAARHFLRTAESRAIHSGWDAKQLAPLNRLKSACDEAASIVRDVEQVKRDLVERCVVVGRRLNQAVPYGSAYVPMDASEIELETHSIELDVEADTLLPAAFTAEVKCPDTGLTTDVLFRLVGTTQCSLTSGVLVAYRCSVAVPC